MPTMVTNIHSIPHYPEPLPVYRRDPDSASIISSAPSYRSEAPSYTSRRPSVAPQPTRSLLNPGRAPRHGRANSVPQGPGLPPARYAQGYESRARGSVGDVESHTFNIASWSNIYDSHAAKQYQAVANRRVNAANKAASQPFLLLASIPDVSLVSPTTAQPSSTTPAAASTTNLALASPVETVGSGLPLHGSSDATATEDDPPLSPQEDPELVGESAAARAKAQRIYREMCLRGDPAALRIESQSWDFMLAQMADWEQRDESWRRFRAEVNARGGAAAMTGVAGRLRSGLGIGGGKKLLGRGGLKGR